MWYSITGKRRITRNPIAHRNVVIEERIKYINAPSLSQVCVSGYDNFVNTRAKDAVTPAIPFPLIRACMYTCGNREVNANTDD